MQLLIAFVCCCGLLCFLENAGWAGLALSETCNMPVNTLSLTSQNASA